MYGGVGAEGAKKILGFGGQFGRFLVEIDVFEVQIPKIFSPAAGFTCNDHFLYPKSKKLSQNITKTMSDFPKRN